MRRPEWLVLALVATVAVNNYARAESVTFTGSGFYTENGQVSNLAASVVFNDLDNGTLQVVLTNTSLGDVLRPKDVLTAIFFTIAGDPTLTPVSAVLTAGSTVLFDSAPVDGNVGGEWAYKDDLAATAVQPEGSNEGIGSAGFGIFGSFNFNGSDLDAPIAVNGLNYGITSAGDDATTGNQAVTGQGGNPVPLIKNSVTFTLSYTGTLSLRDENGNALITAIRFQYGTSLTEPSFGGIEDSTITQVPEPSSLALAGLAVASLMARTRRRRR